MPNEDLAEEITRLRQTVAAFSKVTADLGKKLGAQQDRLVAQQDRQRRFSLILAAVVVAIALLAVGVAWNANRIGEVQDRTTNEVFCPLYKLMLDSYRPELVPAERRAGYEDAFKVVREGNTVLGCPQPSTAPRLSPRPS